MSLPLSLKAGLGPPFNQSPFQPAMDQGPRRSSHLSPVGGLPVASPQRFQNPACFLLVLCLVCVVLQLVYTPVCPHLMHKLREPTDDFQNALTDCSPVVNRRQPISPGYRGQPTIGATPNAGPPDACLRTTRRRRIVSVAPGLQPLCAIAAGQLYHRWLIHPGPRHRGAT
jgi:hypothetical protein